MLLFLYVLGVLSQFMNCSEINDNEVIILPLEYDLSDDDNIGSASIPESLEDSDEVIESYESDDDDDDEEEEEEVEEVSVAGEVNFIGPVQAKGSVLVGANYGYDSPLTSLSFPFPITNGIWYPNFYPTPYPFYAPYTFTHGPLISMFLQDFSSGEVESLEKLGKGYLEVTPLNYGQFLSVVDGGINVRDINADEERTALENDFPDLVDDEQDENTEIAEDDDEDGDEKASPGVVFGGLVPASGAVTIAARF